MAWHYNNATGVMTGPDGVVVGTGYSGNGAGLNNPAAEAIPDVGPIPEGVWRIGTAFDHPHLGPVAMVLIPLALLTASTRSGFFIHGDNIQMNRSASHGCIILGRPIREEIAQSTDRTLIVV